MNSPHERLYINGDHLECRWINATQITDKPVLVFLHEGLGCIASWKTFPDELSQATGLAAFLYSRKGYGASSIQKQLRPTSFLHDEGLTILPKILEKLGIINAILVGHSDGASIAIIHAGSSGNHRIRGLVLEAPHLFVEEETLAGIRATEKAYEKGGLRESLVRYHGENIDSTFFSWTKAWLDPDFESWNIEEYVPGICVPTLAVQGHDDEYGTVAHIEAIEKRIQKPFESVIIPDCGHAPHNDRKDETLEIMADFIARIT